MSANKKNNEVLLTFLEGENEGVELRIIPPRTLIIGRGEDCDIYLSEKKISRNHCQISVEHNGVFVEDLGSTNGSFLNDEPLKEKTKTNNNDAVMMGTTKIKLTFALQDDISSPAPAISTDELDQLNTQDKIQEFPDTSHKIDEKAPLSEPLIKAPSAQQEDNLDDLDFAHESSEDATGQEDFDLVDLSDSLVDETSQPEQSINQTFSKESPVELKSNNDFEIEHSINHHESSFNKAKEAHKQELKANMNASSALSGDLSLMSLPDLLQNLAQNKKGGLLQIESNKLTGKILLKNGVVMQASLGDVIGLKAVYRMLAWNDGDFQLLSAVETPDQQEPLSQNVEGLLMEAFRQMDELKQLKSSLPAFKTSYKINQPLQAPLSRLHPKVLTVLQNIHNLGSLQAALDQSELTDLETAKVFQYLLDKKYIGKK